MQKFDTANFDEKVLKSSLPVLVDYFAEWCGPCKMLAPILEKLSKEFEGKILMGKLDIDENPELAQKYEVQAVPTLIIFKNGQPIKSEIGFKSEDHLRKSIQEII